jgi:hypothetical protein
VRLVGLTCLLAVGAGVLVAAAMRKRERR